MECLGCGYDLRGLSEARCPECGRVFDPGDPATFGPRDPARLDKLLILWNTVAAAWPLVAFGLLHASRVVARVQLGHWPRPSIDDPKSISGLSSVLHVIVALALGSCFPALVANIALVSVALVCARWRAGAVMALVAIACWYAAIMLRNIDPGRGLEWFAD